MNNSLHVILPAVDRRRRRPWSCCSSTRFCRARKRALAWIAAGGLVAVAVVALAQWTSWTGGAALWRVFSGGLVWNTRQAEYGFNGMVELDQYGLFFTVLFCAIGVLTIMLSDGYLSRHGVKPGEFYALLLLVIAGMIGMAISTDLIALLVSFELMSLPTLRARRLPAPRPARPARPRSSTSSTAPSPRRCWPSAWRWSTAPRERPGYDRHPPPAWRCTDARAAS